MSVRILVVDDDRNKLHRIVSVLQEAGADRELIDVGMTGTDARRLLSETAYDFVVLDIALPMRPEDVPDRRGGIKILEELSERGTFKLPLSLLGLTGFEELQEEFGDYFRSKLWILDFYEPADGSWIERLKAKTRFVIARSQQKESARFETEVCVITALQQPEFKALRSLSWNWEGPTSLDEVGYYYEGTFISGRQPQRVVAAAAPRMGMVAAAVLTTKMISKFRPRLLAMTGICGGVKGKCEIGDVLVADPAWDWQMGKFDRGGFKFAPDQIDIATPIAERFALLADDEQLRFEIHRDFQGSKPNNLPQLRLGPVASGSSILAESSQITKLTAQHRKLLGVEMELYGVYTAARDSSPPLPMAFGIKGVSDFADSKKNDDFQAYAAYVATRAFATFCERYAADFVNT